jgi:hypothetical protein
MAKRGSHLTKIRYEVMGNEALEEILGSNIIKGPQILSKLSAYVREYELGDGKGGIDTDDLLREALGTSKRKIGRMDLLKLAHKQLEKLD